MSVWIYPVYARQKARCTAIISEGDADTAQETARQPVRAIRDRKHVPELPESVLKAARRLPKRGFKNRNRLEIEVVNVSALEVFDNDAEVTIDALLEKGIIRDAMDGVKVLGNGELTKKLNVKVNAYSASAKSKIEELGGKAEVI